MGWIHRWAHLASLAPRIANAAAQLPGAKLLAGTARQRDLPRFAPVTFKQWFRRRGTRNEDRPPVILWADTFNNYFHPAVAVAATEVLEEAGFRVVVPRAPLCCGRPLYDYGFLNDADKLIGEVLTYLKPSIEAGTPVVGLEPSCLTVFRDEMLDLRPHDQDARRLGGQVFTLAEFLARQNFRPPAFERDIAVHGHCHQKSIIGLDAEKSLFQAMGVNAEILDDGCCGLAGSFGFESQKYDLSMKIYEHQLGPHLRELYPQRLVVADGFSCRTQIEHATGRRPLHLAQLLQVARHGDRYLDQREDGLEDEDPAVGSAWIRGAALFAGGIGAALGVWYLGRRIFR
jgi:Fe-S oxidoreductase